MNEWIYLDHKEQITKHPIKPIWDVVEQQVLIMDVQPKTLQQLCDAIMSIWARICEGCFQNFVKSMPRRISTVLKAKVCQTQYEKGETNEVAGQRNV